MTPAQIRVLNSLIKLGGSASKSQLRTNDIVLTALKNQGHINCELRARGVVYMHVQITKTGRNAATARMA